MESAYKESLYKHFGAALNMLGNAIALCPDELWHNEPKFFYMAYHTLIFADYYLTNPVKNFAPILPYTITPPSLLPPQAIDDVLPNEHYSKLQIQSYITYIQQKADKLIMQSSSEKLLTRWITDAEVDMHQLCPAMVKHYSLLDIIFYNLRHIQHHVAQLNYLLRERAGIAARWQTH